MAQQVHKTPLRSAPDDARAQLEELALRHDPGEYAAGAQLRAVAAELISRGLAVTAVDYQDGSPRPSEDAPAFRPGRIRSPRSRAGKDSGTYGAAPAVFRSHAR